MISIIVPLYNKENYVVSTINSVLNQTYSNYELIIIDDGSTDNSYDIVDSFTKHNSKVKLYKKENEGVSIARNFGIKKALYPYIVFLDADDYWEKDFLEIIVCLINKYQNVGMYCTGYNVLSSKEKKNISFGKPNTSFIIEDYCKELLLGHTVCMTGSLCVKKEVLDVVGYFKEGVKRGEDIDLWLRIACKYNIAYYAAAKANYVTNSENNAMLSYNSYKESIPYWDWYNYSYIPRKHLESYTTLMLLALANSAYKFEKYEDSLFLLSLCKGYYKLSQRLHLKIKTVFKQTNRYRR